MPAHITPQPQQQAHPLAEVLDASRRVVAVLPAAEVTRQKLCHRSVTVLLFDGQGRLALRKKPKTPGGRPARWDVPAHGPVHAEESVLDAATRALKAELGIHAERLRPVLELPAQPESSNEFLHVFSLVRAEQPTANGQEREGAYYFFAPEELDCLLRDFRELVSPRFIMLAEAMSLKGLWRRRP